MRESRTVDIFEVIDLDRYPMERPGEARNRIVAGCRTDLARDGTCQLEGFMRKEAVDSVLEEAVASIERAFRTDSSHNAYFTETRAGIAEDDPHAVILHSSKRSLGFKYLGPDSALRLLYEWDPLVSFLKEVLSLPALYRDADPVGACSVMFYDSGDELAWHFDNSEFAVTLMLQECSSGGDFEYVPGIRSAEDENLSAVGAALAGDRSFVRSLVAGPGTLTLFRGRHSLHRVSPVAGTTRRVNAVLAYAGEPDHHLTPRTRRLFYGPDEEGSQP